MVDFSVNIQGKRRREDNTYPLWFSLRLVRINIQYTGLNKNLMRKTTDYRTLVVIKCRKITHVKCGRGDISLTIFITLPTKKLESKNSLRSLSIRFVYRYYWMVWFGRKFENKREEFHFKCKLFCSFDALFSVHCL